MQQATGLSLFDWTPPDTDRYGETYVAEFDQDRLSRQQSVVYAVMKDGHWRTLGEIHALTGAPEASISARLRDLRNMFSLTVDRRRRGEPSAGLFEYRVSP